MIVDTSALIAIVFRESGYERLIDLLREKGPSGIAAPSIVKAGIVSSARLCTGTDFRRTDLELA